MIPAPILLFTYNRLPHTRNTINALLQNKAAAQSDIYIFSDGPAHAAMIDSVKHVRNYLKTIKGFKNIYIKERTKNYGLGNNIIEGVSEIVNSRGRVIVVEDDLISSPYFLDFMNDGLHTYQDDEQVISIHGYTYPVKQKLPETFFIKGADCLGWATWKRGWKDFEPDGAILLKKLNESNLTYEFDFKGNYPFTQMLKDQINGKNTSWAVRWYASAFLKEKYTLYPGKSLIYHTGGDGSGTNTGLDSLLDVRLAETPVQLKKINIAQNADAYNAFAEFYKKLANPPFLYKVKRKFKQYIHNRHRSTDRS